MNVGRGRERDDLVDSRSRERERRIARGQSHAYWLVPPFMNHPQPFPKGRTG